MSAKHDSLHRPILSGGNPPKVLGSCTALRAHASMQSAQGTTSGKFEECSAEGFCPRTTAMHCRPARHRGIMLSEFSGITSYFRSLSCSRGCPQESAQWPREGVQKILTRPRPDIQLDSPEDSGRLWRLSELRLGTQKTSEDRIPVLSDRCSQPVLIDGKNLHISQQAKDVLFWLMKAGIYSASRGRSCE